MRANLKGNPLPAVTTWLFIAVSAFMFALTCFLAIGLPGPADTLKSGKLPPAGGLPEGAGEGCFLEYRQRSKKLAA